MLLGCFLYRYARSVILFGELKSKNTQWTMHTLITMLPADTKEESVPVEPNKQKSSKAHKAKIWASLHRTVFKS